MASQAAAATLLQNASQFDFQLVEVFSPKKVLNSSQSTQMKR